MARDTAQFAFPYSLSSWRFGGAFAPPVLRAPAFFALARALAGLSSSDFRRESRDPARALEFAPAGIADAKPDLRPSSDPLRIHPRRELLLVSLHALLSAEEREPHSDSVARGSEGTDRRQSPLPGAGRRIANHGRRCGRCLLAIGTSRRTGRNHSVCLSGRARADANDARPDAARAAAISRAPRRGRRAAPGVGARRYDAGRTPRLSDRPDQERKRFASGARGLHPSRAGHSRENRRTARVRAQFHRHAKQCRFCAGCDSLVSGRSRAHAHLAHAQFSAGS